MSAALSAAVLAPTVAYADTLGTAGYVVSLNLNESSADDYAAERGSLLITEGQTTRKYIWGGQVCSGRNISEGNIALLGMVLQTGNLVVVPRFKVGAGGVRCLVGFRLERQAS